MAAIGLECYFEKQASLTVSDGLGMLKLQKFGSKLDALTRSSSM